MSTDQSLRTLVQLSAQIEESLILSSGEITPEIETALAVKDIQLPEKIDNYSLVMDRMKSLSEFYSQKADVFLRLSKAANGIVDRCKDNLKFAMIEMNTNELLGNDYRFKLQNAQPSTVIEDENKIPDSYKIIETITKIDKKRVAEDLKIGVPVEGARLEQSQFIRTYATKVK